jgi:hypothetical protein
MSCNGNDVSHQVVAVYFIISQQFKRTHFANSGCLFKMVNKNKKKADLMDEKQTLK